MKLGITNTEDLKQLSKILKIKNLYILTKDYIKKPLKNGNYIINLDNHNGQGTHWVSFIKKDDIIYYFDSFGLPPPEQILKINETKIYYNVYNIQDIEETSCGFYCLYFIYNMKIYNNDYKKFLELFVNNPLNNEDIISDFFHKFI
jgi:hypothetical protein